VKPLQHSVKESLESATQIFAAALLNSPASEYLASRALSPDTAVSHRLGYVATKHPGFERMVGRLAIPNICAAGHVVGLKFRALDDAEPKYDQQHGQLSRLFNLRSLNEDTDVMVLTEGELDTVTLTQMGVPAVAVPGASAWKPHHFRLFEGYRKVVLIQDDDKAGRDMAKRILDTPLPVIVMQPPDGFNDVNSAMQGGASDALLDMIRGSSK
jgi:DNA primase